MDERDNHFLDDMDELDENEIPDGNFKILSAEEKKLWSKKFRQMAENVRNVDLEGNSIPVVVKKMRDNVIGQNETLNQVGVNEMLTHDAKVLNQTFQKSFHMIKRFNTECKFDKHNYNSRLARFLAGNTRLNETSNENPVIRIRPKQLIKIGLKCQHIMHHVSPLTRTFLTPENHKKKTIVRRPRQTQSSVATQPTRVDSSNMNNKEDESEKRLRQIHNQLHKLQIKNVSGTPILQCTVNPNSFGATVENLFNIAFLARQKMIKIESSDDPNGEPFVTALKTSSNRNAEDEDEEDKKDNRPPVQSVLTFDHDTYELLIKNLHITKPALK